MNTHTHGTRSSMKIKVNVCWFKKAKREGLERFVEVPGNQNISGDLQV